MTEKKENAVRSPNIITLQNRSDLTVSGVNDVDSFDEKSVVAYTDYGQLTIQGERLNIKRLSVETGELTVEGEISALIYTENRPRENVFKRLFR